MCLYPKLIRNRKYCVTEKNNGNVPVVNDPRVLYVPVGCQKCIECRKQKARQWSIRLQEEIRNNKNGKFVTLTYSNESIKELTGAIAKQNEGIIPEGYELDNAIATIGVRRFLERWRKKNKISVKHWLVTELGQGKHKKYQNTENLHLHGIIFGESEEIIQHWQYGHVYIGSYVNEASANYMTKYINKVDMMHKEYMPKVLTSAGIGKGYTDRLDAKINKYKEEGTKETYTTREGKKIALPIYYRNKIYTEEEREKLWIEKLDKNVRYVEGRKISMEDGGKVYMKALEEAQKRNKRLGYGDDEVNWSRIKYENEVRKLKIAKRIELAK